MNIFFQSRLWNALLIGALLVGLSVMPVTAEQQVTYGDYQVHYMVVPTTFLDAKVADKYSLPRGRDRALVNVTVLDAMGLAVSSIVTGRSENLLGQQQLLSFTEVREGDAIYYLALLRHADEEFHRVALDIILPDGETGELRFQQQMFWDR